MTPSYELLPSLIPFQYSQLSLSKYQTYGPIPLGILILTTQKLREDKLPPQIDTRFQSCFGTGSRRGHKTCAYGAPVELDSVLNGSGRAQPYVT